MKICFISPFPPERDGVGDYTYLLARNIKRRCEKCEISVIARKINNTPTKSYIHNDIVVLRSWDMSSLFSSLKSIFAIIKDIMNLRPRIVHFHYGTTRQYGWSAGEPFVFILAALRFILRVKTIMSLHGFWTLDEAKQIFQELTGKKLLAKIYKVYYMIFIKLILNLPGILVNVVIDIDSPVTATVSKISGRNDIVEIPHGVFRSQGHIDRSKAKKRLGLGNKFVILLFGFIRRGKGYKDVMRGLHRVLKKNPSFKSRIVTLIVGAANSQENLKYVEELKGIVSQLGLENNVSFRVKYLRDSEILTYICAADVMMLTYSRRGGPSGVLARALSYETPVIISEDGKYITSMTRLPAIVIENNDEHNIAKAIELLMREKKRRDELRRQASVYKETYSFVNISDKYLSIYSMRAHK